MFHRFEQRNDAHVRHRAARQIDLLQVAEAREEQYVVVVNAPARAAVQDFDFGHCGVTDAAEELVGVEEGLAQRQNGQPLGKVLDGDVGEVDVLRDKRALDDEGPQVGAALTDLDGCVWGEEGDSLLGGKTADAKVFHRGWKNGDKLLHLVRCQLHVVSIHVFP